MKRGTRSVFELSFQVPQITKLQGGDAVALRDDKTFVSMRASVVDVDLTRGKVQVLCNDVPRPVYIPMTTLIQPAAGCNCARNFADCGVVFYSVLRSFVGRESLLLWCGGGGRPPRSPFDGSAVEAIRSLQKGSVLAVQGRRAPEKLDWPPKP